MKTEKNIGSILVLFLLCAGGMAAHSQQSSSAPRGQTANVAPAVTTATDVTTTGGTNGTVAYFNGSSTVLPSALQYANGSLGIGRYPASTLDVNGRAIIRGILNIARAGDATPSAGANSYPFLFQASVYNSTYKNALLPYFEFQSEPVGNNTGSTGATLNLLYYSGVGAYPSESGIYINPNGNIHFAPTQTFPITQGPAGPAGPTGATGPVGPQGPVGPAGTVPVNLSVLSGQLSTTQGVAYLGAERYKFPGACVIGDVFLSVNGYLGNAYPADGRLLPIQGNAALFTIIGANFGGDGISNFAVPDLRAFAPKGMQYSICANGTFPGEN